MVVVGSRETGVQSWRFASEQLVAEGVLHNSALVRVTQKTIELECNGVRQHVNTFAVHTQYDGSDRKSGARLAVGQSAPSESSHHSMVNTWHRPQT